MGFYLHSHPLGLDKLGKDFELKIKLSERKKVDEMDKFSFSYN